MIYNTLPKIIITSKLLSSPASLHTTSRRATCFCLLTVATAVAAMSTTTTKSDYNGALIFLHGLGDSPSGWSILQKQLPTLQPRLSTIKYIFPPAPILPLSINGGAKMTSWFDIYEWPISIGDPDDQLNKLKAVNQIETLINELVIKDNIPRNKIVIGGFSQGGAIALLSAYYPKDNQQEQSSSSTLAGCVVLSGWLTLVNDFDNKSIEHQNNIPLFWGHGQYDDKVLFTQQKFGITKLKSIGVTNIEDYQYPIGHESTSSEIKSLASFIDRVIFEGDNGNADTKAASTTTTTAKSQDL